MSDYRERIYVTVQFNAWDRQSWTYHYDGERVLREGDFVRVETPKHGMKDVTVVTVGVPKPSFATKPVYLP